MILLGIVNWSDRVNHMRCGQVETPTPFHRKHGSEPSRSIVQALPSSKTISLFHKRYSRPRKKAKRGAKSATVEKSPRSKSRKGSNLDSNFGVDEDDNHSLSTSSYIPESDHNQKYPKKRSLSSLPEMKSGRSWKNTGKRRRCRPQMGSGKAMGKIPRTKSKTRGSFLVTEDEKQEQSVTAAETIVDMSSSDSARKSSKQKSPLIRTSATPSKV